MSQEIVLPRNVRIFKRSYGDLDRGKLLSQTGLMLGAGVRVIIGEPLVMSHDHRDHLVVQVINDDQWEVEYEIFIIVKEIGPLNSPVRA
jgi:hypothetical protein